MLSYSVNLPSHFLKSCTFTPLNMFCSEMFPSSNHAWYETSLFVSFKPVTCSFNPMCSHFCTRRGKKQLLLTTLSLTFMTVDFFHWSAFSGWGGSASESLYSHGSNSVSLTILATLSTFFCSAQADYYCNNPLEQCKMPEFMFPVFISS